MSNNSISTILFIILCFFTSCDKEYVLLYTESNDIDRVIQTHLDREPELYAMAYNYPFYFYPGNEKWDMGATYNKRLVFAWISDVHGGDIEYGRFVKYSNTYNDVIDFMLVSGDLSEVSPRDGGWSNTQDKYAGLSKIPMLIGLGNHDVTGNSGNEVVFDSIYEMDKELFLPWENQIGWTNKGQGSYYYKDFKGPSYNYRVIVLNDYERPRLVSDGSWETISFDADLPEYSNQKSYEKGDRVNYQAHSYQAVKSPNDAPPSRQYFDCIDGRYISSEQAVWFCDALSTMPDNCLAIICTHMLIGHCLSVPCNFSYPNGDTSGFQMCQNGHVLVDILNAFMGKTVVSQTYEMTKKTSDGSIDGDIIDGFGYTLTYDFTSVANNVGIKCCFSGHNHVDMVNILTGINHDDVYNLSITAGSSFFQCGDLGTFGERGRDAFNIVSVDNNKGLKMMRIGQDITSDFVKRDHIALDI